MRPALTIFAFYLLAAPAVAQGTVDQAAAKRLLFDGRDSQLAIVQVPFLTETDIATLQAMPQAAQLKYYGALAADPTKGLQSDATQAAFNFHTLEAARAAALRACGAGCVIVAEVRPRGYAPGRALSLNQDATRAIEGRAFRRAGSDPAVAISPATGSWGLGGTPGEAVGKCAAQGASDCNVAVTR